MNTTTRKQLGLPPMPVNANYVKTSPPVCGVFVVLAFGMIVGFSIAILTFTFAL